MGLNHATPLKVVAIQANIDMSTIPSITIVPVALPLVVGVISPSDGIKHVMYQKILYPANHDEKKAISKVINESLL
tara:strand:- start:41 stop:268 length:228 start_codon:yes stop_codon:yes gene_type:complete